MATVCVYYQCQLKLKCRYAITIGITALIVTIYLTSSSTTITHQCSLPQLDCCTLHVSCGTFAVWRFDLGRQRRHDRSCSRDVSNSSEQHHRCTRPGGQFDGHSPPIDYDVHRHHQCPPFTLLRPSVYHRHHRECRGPVRVTLPLLLPLRSPLSATAGGQECCDSPCDRNTARARSEGKTHHGQSQTPIHCTAAT